MYNMVGFQTNLKFPEQRRVFGLIPALKDAAFLRYGVMHRNTFINAPTMLEPTFCMRARPYIFFAGQITGVEGYVESAASGLCAGINALRSINGGGGLLFPDVTAMGALQRHVSTPVRDYQPMNINFGLMPELPERVKGKREKGEARSQRALEAMEELISRHGLGAQAG